MHAFERLLSVSAEDVEFELCGFGYIPWSDFVLNPRRLRGSDFLMRWSQGVWSEHRLIQAVNKTRNFYAVPYGPSSVAPSDDTRAFELYFERLESAGLGKVKKPDLLIFPRSAQTRVDQLIADVGGAAELPFTREESLNDLLDLALIAAECENSLWRAEKMPDYGIEMKPQKWLGGKIGMKKTAVLPTVILKDEDLEPLHEWQSQNRIGIHIWHAFYERAYGLTLDKAQRLIADGSIHASAQVFQAPGGPTTTKILYRIYYHHAYPLAVTTEDPTLVADCIEDKNGHILPYVKFQGGKLRMVAEALKVLAAAKNSRH